MTRTLTRPFWFGSSSSAGGGGGGGNGGGGGGGDPTLPQVMPYNGAEIAAGYGVQGNPTRTDQVYAGTSSTNNTFNGANVDAWVDRYAAMGASFVRGRWNPGHPGSLRLAARARLRGLGVLWNFIPEGSTKPTDQTPAETRTAVRDLIANAADVTIAVEGINEPNNNRGSSTPVPLDWASNAVYGVVAHQIPIWEEVKGSASMRGVEVLSPSLHDQATDNSYTQTNPEGGKFHYEQLVTAGILDYIEVAGFHTYQGKGNPPTYKVAGRVDHIDGAYGPDMPLWATETGYTTAVANTTSGHAIASEAAAGTYGPRLLLEYAGGFTLTHPRQIRMARFEGLDDYDGGAKDIVEANFGLWRVSSASADASFDPTTWTPKPEVAKMKAILDVLKAPPGTPAYTPQSIGLRITRPVGSSDVRTMLVQVANGTVYLFMWRNQPVMDTATKETIAVAPVSIDVEDSNGRRTVGGIDGEVSWTTVAR